MYGALASLWLIVANGQAMVICKTHQFCPMGGSCACIVAATSAFNRYYYFDIATFNRGTHYRCSLQGGPSSLWLDRGASRFPAGSDVRCQSNCGQFPLTLLIDTAHMQDTTGHASLKYYVPASDIPDHVNVICQPSL